VALTASRHLSGNCVPALRRLTTGRSLRIDRPTGDKEGATWH
jgi:hypothetical protein